MTSGGTDSDATILKGGTEIVSGGGIATDATVSSGGLLVVSSGGLGDPTRVLSGGKEIVSAGGTDYGAQISGGTQLVFGLASVAKSSREVPRLFPVAAPPRTPPCRAAACW